MRVGLPPARVPAIQKAGFWYFLICNTFRLLVRGVCHSKKGGFRFAAWRGRMVPCGTPLLCCPSQFGYWTAIGVRPPTPFSSLFYNSLFAFVHINLPRYHCRQYWAIKILRVVARSPLTGALAFCRRLSLCRRVSPRRRKGVRCRRISPLIVPRYFADRFKSRDFLAAHNGRRRVRGSWNLIHVISFKDDINLTR